MDAHVGECGVETASLHPLVGRGGVRLADLPKARIVALATPCSHRGSVRTTDRNAVVKGMEIAVVTD